MKTLTRALQFPMLASAAAFLFASPVMATNTGTLVGIDIPSTTSAGKSHNDDVGLTVAYLDTLFGRSDISYIGTLSGPGNNAPALPLGQSISGSIIDTTATYSSSHYKILAYDVKASNHNALYEVVPGVMSGSLDSSAILNHGREIPAISHADFFGFSAGGVPEPATWAMMLLGFGAVGFSLRRRNQGTLVQTA